MTALRGGWRACCLAVAPLLCPLPAWAADGGATLRAEIASRWHVTVIETALETRIVPLVATSQRPVTMQDLSPLNEAACLQAVVTAFQAYPAALVTSLVGQVALADGIDAWNIRIGGFHAPGLIALNCEEASENAGFDVDSLHDEMAALFLLKAPLNDAAWRAFNPPGFQYGDVGSYRAELRDPHGRDGDGALHRNGFVSALGLTGIENDFQTYAERIFGHPHEFAALLRAQPAMRGKARMVMDLYVGQAPSLATQFAESGLASVPR
ncbi:hypothetical protein [Acidisoma cladoniae]|uniref:hypothetical protein n=1 Tax=Acidisoma cladoniae TaxID=3040935 RepID=UPI00254EC734|nr:hypothetical protein [Acidisoma sp. PAMC 29798]